MNFRSAFFLGVLFLALAALASGGASAQAETHSSTSPLQIDRVDPPNWWADHFPSPMLLVHGAGLDRAQFRLVASGVRILRTEASVNGHWAFLWLDTVGAPAQTLTLVATCAAEEVRSHYTLAPRHPDARHQTGFHSDDVLYLVMPDRFADGAPNPSSDDRTAIRGWHGGDLVGIRAHLDYLQALGVTTLWTTPVFSNVGMADAYHGYAATDLYAIDAHFGTLEDYRQLSASLHARGMKLVIDLVPNHVGAGHPWLDDPPTPTWFHGSRADHLALADNFYSLTDPHAAPSAATPTTDGWFTDQMPDLNQSDPRVAAYFIDNALWWVETANLDGIRLDTFPYVDRAYWHQFHATLHATYPNLTTVGEVFHRDPEVVSWFAGGRCVQGTNGISMDTGLDTPFDFPLQFALRDVFAHGKSMTVLAETLRADALYPHPERLVTFIGNHDTTRFLTEAGGSFDNLRLALGLLLTLRGTPQLYSGDEIAMAGGEDPDNRHDFPGGFPGDTRSAFTSSGRTAPEQSTFAWTQGLLQLRAEHPALASGLEQHLAVDADSFAFLRATSAKGCDATPDAISASDRLLVLVNRSAQPKSFELDPASTALAHCTRFEPVAAASGPRPSITGNHLHVELPAHTLAIYTAR